ncbi:MAG: hypothetical protein QM673_16675 [Gordonia sp. (in: high G+C Gram-positive bacteria)]
MSKFSEPPARCSTSSATVAVISPVEARERTFGQFPGLTIPDTFDAPLPDAELAAWESTS